MAPDRVEEWLELRNPLASSSGSRRFGGSDVIDIAPGATEPMVAATSNRVPAEMEDTALGRANAGKTTILQRVCGSTELPEVFDEEGNKIHGVVVQGTSTCGYHSIKHQFVFQSNPGFVFHDSCGFEAGSTKQFDEMKNFVIETVTAAEKKFFNECDTGYVPVIMLLTKVDTLNREAIQERENESLEIEVTDDRVEQKERELLEEWLACVKDGLDECKFPPRAYMALQKMQEENADCTALMQCTANALNEKSLQRLLISTQQSNIMLSTHVMKDIEKSNGVRV
ncbi:hypothetical protein F5J12DRAFT_782739 [Pisolithus orientalis]|uniref:uncharacterized protein n=1 Tax=Pisolithus orientalis TaxID=936130 RepID=UPI00222579C2|nr:uncharacterized protein F5J12DRAFT_782739 [Pisolithus orientalis]KAI6007750.1 hypothetical protein F5J12DRAFT_782739 [Pisolithus orientalis]